MSTPKHHKPWLQLSLALLLLASGCAAPPPATNSTSELAPPNAASRVPLAPEPSELQQRVETMLQRLDSELAALLNLLPAPTTNTPAPKR